MIDVVAYTSHAFIKVRIHYTTLTLPTWHDALRNSKLRTETKTETETGKKRISTKKVVKVKNANIER